MESLSTGFSSSPLFLNHSKKYKPISNPIFLVPYPFSNFVSTSCHLHQTHFPLFKKTPLLSQSHNLNHQSDENLTSDFLNLSHNRVPLFKNPSFCQLLLKCHFSLLCMGFSFPVSCFASEATVSTEEVSNKINLEAILVSIDDFFNRNPFFVAGVTFIWLVVIPLTQEYLQKYKLILAIDAFRKLRDDPNCQLLDIRYKKILRYLGSPNLNVLNKNVAQVEFIEGNEEGFVKEVLQKFTDPATTIICILDNFDGNSMNVAELLVKNGFKEAHAVRGGVRGKNGWQEIQETLLPPSVHIYPRKKVKKSQPLEMKKSENNQPSSDAALSMSSSKGVENGYVEKSTVPGSKMKHSLRSLSPYPYYPDLKPPSSPTPSKPLH